MSFKRAKIADLSTKVISGGTPRRNVEEYWLNGNIPWLKTNQIGVFRIYDTDEHITELGLKESSAKLLYPNTITVAMYGDGVTRGKVSVISKVMATNQACCNIEVDPYKADYLYVYYSLKQKYDFLRHISNGGAQQNLNAGLIKDFEIDLPSLESQKVISNILSTLDEKIEVNNQINQTLEAMAQALFKQWFIDFEFPNENGEPYKSSGGEMVESELGLIPKGWEVGTLGRLAQLSTKGVNPTAEPNITFEHFSIPAFDSQKAPEFVRGETILSNKYRVEKDSVLMSKLNPTTKRIWYPVVVSENAICSTEFMNYLPVLPNTREFIYCVLNSEAFTDYLVSHATGSTNSRQRVTPKTTLDFNLALPHDVEFIERFNQNIASQIKMGNKNIVENQMLCNIRDTFLPKLISGEIRVPMESAGGEA